MLRTDIFFPFFFGLSLVSESPLRRKCFDSCPCKVCFVSRVLARHSFAAVLACYRTQRSVLRCLSFFPSISILILSESQNLFVWAHFSAHVSLWCVFDCQKFLHVAGSDIFETSGDYLINNSQNGKFSSCVSWKVTFLKTGDRIVSIPRFINLSLSEGSVECQGVLVSYFWRNFWTWTWRIKVPTFVVRCNLFLNSYWMHWVPPRLIQPLETWCFWETAWMVYCKLILRNIVTSVHICARQYCIRSFSPDPFTIRNRFQILMF